MKNIIVISGALFTISSVIVACSMPMWLLLLVLLSILLYVACFNVCRRNESTWIFVLVAAAMLPFNAAICVKAYQLFANYLIFGIMGRITTIILLFYALFSLEEISMGIIGRVIWKRQK